MPRQVLTVNVGSSSVKMAVFTTNPDPAPLAAASVTGIGSARPELRLASQNGAMDTHAALGRTHSEATREALDALGPWIARLSGVSHRIVHGGTNHTEPEWMGPELLADLDTLRPLAPHHLPPSLDAFDVVRRAHPDARHLASFDTTFHRQMPAVAQMYPLPRRYWHAGVRRYGFHGLSCESVLQALDEIDSRAVRGRIIIAHLGSGASMTAVRDGRSIETTMGFSPIGGLMMGRRSGDLDPGVLLYALEHERIDSSALRRLLMNDAGLLGVSERSQDMSELLALEASDPQAAEAVALFCHIARKAVGALTAVLGGLDTLIFTGGIGEHSAPVRERIASSAGFLGIRLNADGNRTHAPIISAPDSAVTVRVIPSNEERVLADHARARLAR